MRVPRRHWRSLLVVATASLVGGCGLLGGARPLEEAIRGTPRPDRTVRLAVNGEEIPPAALDRAFVYIHGRPYLERKIRDFLVADEIDRRRRSGQPVEDLRISDEEVGREVASRKEELQQRFPQRFQEGPDVDAILRAQGLDEVSLADEQASLLLFDRVFIPEDSTKWSETTVQALETQGGEVFGEKAQPDVSPPVVETPATERLTDPALQELVDRTIQAIRGQGAALEGQRGQDFVDKAMKGLREGRKKNPTEPMSPFYRTIFRQWITKDLKASSNIKTASDGLPPDVVLTVNGRPLLTAEAYPAVARRVTALDRKRVVRWMAWSTATRQALIKAGVYLSEEEFLKEWQAHVGPYEKTPFSIEVVATAFKKFPSYDLYREYYRLRKSFERMIEKEVTDEALIQHRARVQDFLGDGKVDAQVILLSAFDYTAFDWKGPDAFENAKKEAEGVLEALRGGLPFEEAIDRFSQFFEPPPPAPGQQAPQGPRPNRGRFGPQSRNQLEFLLGESEFDEIVRGTSMGEILFHEAAPLEVVGPMRGPLGWYIGRVLGRFPGAKKVDFADKNSRNLLREDYITRRFIDWSAGVVAESRFKIR